MSKPLEFLKTWSDQLLDPADPKRGPDIDLNDAITGALAVRAVLQALALAQEVFPPDAGPTRVQGGAAALAIFKEQLERLLHEALS